MIVNPLIHGGGGSGQTFTFTNTGLFRYPEVVTIPNNVTSLTGTQAGFYQHTEIKEIKFQAGSAMTATGSNAFASCTGLKKITFPDSLRTFGSNTLTGCTALEEVIIPEGVTSLGTNTFNSCSSLKTVKLPSTLTDLGTAFYGCQGLEAIDIPSSVTSISSNAFYGCTHLAEVTIPEGVVTIGNSAFANCTSLEEIELPSSVTLLGAYSLSRNNKLKTIVLNSCPKSANSTTGSENSWTALSNNHPLIGCTNLEEFTVANGVEWIYDLNLSTFTKLTHDSLANLINSLYDYSGGTAHTLTIGATNLAKLSAEEIAAATAKNWTIA